jgi:hypothetical protein
MQVQDPTQDLDIMLSRISGYSSLFVSIQDPSNPSNLPTHSNYTWTSNSDGEVIISHNE